MIRIYFLLTLACTPPEVKLPDDHDTSDSDTDRDTDTYVDDGVSPYLISGTATCIEVSNGEKSWSFNAEIDDAQGTQNIRPTQDIAAYEGDIELFRKPSLACNNSGICIGSLREDFINLYCANQASYTFRVYLTDLEGNQVANGFKLEWVEPEESS